MTDRPIGVFDSGIGGLTVVRALLKRLPQEDIIYFGDTARVPYGTKSRETIERFALQDAAFLQQFSVKLIVVACHTASSLALQALQRAVSVPVVGVNEPGAYAAVRSTKTGRIGVIGTPSTINSEAYVQELRRISPDVKVFGQACPLFVPLAEEGWVDGPITEAVARKYLTKLIKARVDTVILGCTHYPLLKRVIGRVMGPGVTLVDPAVQTAERVSGVLTEYDLSVFGRTQNQCRFYASDDPLRVTRLAKRFLGRPVPWVDRVTELPEIKEPEGLKV